MSITPASLIPLDLFSDVFGANKTAARLVIGVASLPPGTPVELKVILEVAT